jgi:hypothetical protein
MLLAMTTRDNVDIIASLFLLRLHHGRRVEIGVGVGIGCAL